MEELFRPLIERMGWDAAYQATCGMGSKAGDPGKAPLRARFATRRPRPLPPGPQARCALGFFARGTHTIVPLSRTVEAPGRGTSSTRSPEPPSAWAYPHTMKMRGRVCCAMQYCAWAGAPMKPCSPSSPRATRCPTSKTSHDFSSIHPRIVCVAQNINGREGNAILGRETRVLWGAPHMKDELLGCTFVISPTAFYQTNPQQTEVYTASPSRAWRSRRGRRAT